jgi:minor histocompatibility antigen H13
MVGYVAGLGATIVVMNVFNAAQPALLYIVPAVLGAVAGHAALAGELRAVAAWEETAAEEAGEGAEGSESPTAADGGAEEWVKVKPAAVKKAA